MAPVTSLAKLRILMALLLLICWLLCCHAAFPLRCSTQDRTALLTVMAHLGLPGSVGPSWNGSECCTWEGVKCNQQNRVNYLSLGDFSFQSGTISPALCELQMLQTLDLSLNALGGSIPPCLCKLQMLRTLDLSYNIGLGGSIPPCLCKLQKLQFLGLSYNGLGGSIPPCLCKLQKLQTLDLSLNGLGGGIPPCLGELQKITYLDLFANSIVGRIPASLGTLANLETLMLGENQLRHSSDVEFLCNLSHLEFLDISSSGINGTLPACLSQLRNLSSVDLDGNELTGSIPTEWKNLTHLSYLDVSDNHLQIQELPRWLWSLRTLTLSSCGISSVQACDLRTDALNCSLVNLDLSGNQLNPSDLSWVWTLPALRRLTLSSCNISSFPPCEVRTDASNCSLSNLDLSGNHLNSDLSWLWTLPSLQGLTLSSCNISSFPPCEVRTDASPCSPLHLDSLDLSANPLNSDLHTAMANFRIDGSLTLSSCGLGGYLSPDFLGGIDLTSLWNFNLSRNSLVGTIPSALGNASQMNVIDLSSNQLVGTIPSALGNMSHLQTLDLSNNSLTGALPTSFGQRQFTYLTFIRLGYNSLEGAIPQGLGQVTELLTLSLPGNKLNGTIPNFGGSSSFLRILDLSDNHLEGTLHELRLSSLSSLRVLSLASNRLSGTIEDVLRNVSQVLQVIDLSHNNFTGSIPLDLRLLAFSQSYATATWGQLHQGTLYEEVRIDAKGQVLDNPYVLLALLAFNLEGNNITGTIPASLANLSNIVYLSLANNHLNGHIPTSLSKLRALESLDLSQNSFTGLIPSTFSSLTSLEYFNVSYNHLVGPIPLGGQFNTFDAMSYEGNEKLCDTQEDRHILKPCIQLQPSLPPQTPRQPSVSKLKQFFEEHAPIPAICVSYVVSLIIHLWVFNHLLNRLFPMVQ